VEALRGWQFTKPVKKQLCTPEHVRTYVEKEVAEQLPAGKAALAEAFLRTIGLLPKDVDLRETFYDLMEEQVGGFYDRDTGAMCLVSRGSPLPALVERSLLAHELTHALDDQKVGLDAMIKGHVGKSEDMDLVTGALVEGSATSLMMQYMMRAQLSGKYPLGDLQAYSTQEMERSRKFMDAPPYFTVLLATYMCGMEFLAGGPAALLMLTPDNRRVGERFLKAAGDMPRSTEQILHPEKYWDAATRDEPVVVDDDAAVRLLQAPGRWVVHKDTLGEMLTAILTLPQGHKRDMMAMSSSAGWTNDAAAGWGGDRFYLLAAGPDAEAAKEKLDGLAGVWITLWDTPKDRDEFLKAYEATPQPLPRRVIRLGTSAAVVLLGYDEAAAAAMEQRLRQSPPPMKRGDRPWTPWSL
jgi:hypothetical protein